MSVLQKLKDAKSLKELAILLSFKPSRVSYLLYKLDAEKKYSKFQIPKKSGGIREIQAPEPRLKALQKSLADLLYECTLEIESNGKKRPSLSHGFRKHHSIVTNARGHNGRRYVLNVDLEGFFPSINFGRVRGFFIADKSFSLNEKVATVVAQIACFENKLPQGSPCSPVISNLIGHLLDVRLVRLAKAQKCSYSRYADDITFSTNQKNFPPAMAVQDEKNPEKWIAGTTLSKTIENAWFKVNHAKTRLQSRTKRQSVTGVVVNKHVNVEASYYKNVRAMCHSVFAKGEYHKPIVKSGDPSKGAEPSGPEMLKNIAPLEGMLAHIDYVKFGRDSPRSTVENASGKSRPPATRRLYEKFLFFKHFVYLDKPLVLCEGKTDNVYLHAAIRQLKAHHSTFIGGSDQKPEMKIRFFKYSRTSNGILGLNGGSGHLANLIAYYSKNLKDYNFAPLLQPVIVLIDNDDGAPPIFKTIKQNYKVTIDHSSADLFYRICHNLYLVKTPEKATTYKSYIEELFDDTVLQKKLNGKTFTTKKDYDKATQYGKEYFSKYIVRPNEASINFTKFSPLLDRIASAVSHYGAAADK
ncbi:MAG: RNA-directed DNA polymerase [Rhodospirillales bacterium]|nr:MAG: RNA-directed DNA polymerase [Rhodospirillales bacterium]